MGEIGREMMEKTEGDGGGGRGRRNDAIEQTYHSLTLLEGALATGPLVVGLRAPRRGIM